MRLVKLGLVNLGEIILLDERGRIVYVSKEYAANMGVSVPDALGKPIAQVIEDSHLPEVLRSGKPDRGAIYYRNGTAFWVNRFPIWDGGKVIGVIAQSMLTADSASARIRSQLERSIRELNFYREKYEQTATSQFSIDSIISRSQVMEQLKQSLGQIAKTRSTVLISGESGTGKEVFASVIHALSPRKSRPFVRLNCAAIPDALLESELFGYAEGAFTGALKGGKIGDFEAAHGGTVFLDEVDSLSPSLQAKLLRVIQDREIKRVGSTKSTPIDVRFLFATNQDLAGLVRAGRFREDFYYRINVINLHLPPLRERPEDIEPLVGHFIRKYSRELGMSLTGIEPGALRLLEHFQWPGNVRELENCIERAFNYTEGPAIRERDIRLPGLIPTDPSAPSQPAVRPLRQVRAQAEKAAIRQALDACRGSRAKAARLLEIDRSSLYEKMKRYQRE